MIKFALILLSLALIAVSGYVWYSLVVAKPKGNEPPPTFLQWLFLGSLLLILPVVGVLMLKWALIR